jgi:sugar phosphate permease
MNQPSDQKRLLRWQILLLVLIVVSYAGFYLCRSNLSVTLPLLKEQLIAQGVDPDDANTQLSRIFSVGIVAYGFGKFIGGGLADTIGGRRTFLGGMSGAVFFTCVFAASGTLPLFTLAWIGNRLAQSFGWPGMVKLCGRWFSFSRYGMVMGIVSLSYLFGDAAARWFLGELIEFHISWSGVFLVCAAVLFVLLLLNYYLVKESPVDVDLDEPLANPLNVYGKKGEQSGPESWRSVLLPLLSSLAFWYVCLISLGCTVLRETFNNWTPTYYVEAVNFSKAEAGKASSWFPLLGGVAVLLAGFANDRLGRGGRALIITGGLGLSSFALVVLGSANFAGSQLWPVVLVSLIGFLMLGPYSYLSGALSLDFGGKRGAATACAIIDGVGYLGSFLSGEPFARLQKKLQWQGSFSVLAGVALLTSIVGLIFWMQQRGVMRKERE